MPNIPYQKLLSFGEKHHWPTKIIDTFRRKKNEPLVAATLRVTVDINQMEYAKVPDAWNGI
jgi:hypothetical protein